MQLRRIALPSVLALGCSTLAPKPEPTTCSSSADCDDDQVCEQGFCLDARAKPPQVYVGFDLQQQAQVENGYRLEIAGCDVEVEVNASSGVNAIEVLREPVQMQLNLQVFQGQFVNEPTVADMLLADFELTQSSRFARDVVTQTVRAPTIEGTDTVLPTTIFWPRYHAADSIPPLPSDVGGAGHILWKIAPYEPLSSTTGPRATMYRALQPPIADGYPPDHELVETDRAPELRPCTGDNFQCCPAPEDCEAEDVVDACVPPEYGEPGITSAVCRAPGTPILTFDVEYDTNCDRPVDARVVRVDPVDLTPIGDPVDGATFTIRYADFENERLGLSAIGSPWPMDARECTRDDECVDDVQFCNRDTNHCEVALTGLVAAGGSTSAGVTRNLQSRVFSYCEDEDNVPLDRSFSIRIDPPPTAALPPMTYEVDVEFDPSVGDPPTEDLGGDTNKALCMPDLGPTSQIAVELRGSPAPLLGGTLLYECCDLDCLPTDASSTPPARPDSCGVIGATVDATTRVQVDVETWSSEESGCVPPVMNDQGVVGVLTRSAMCPSNEDGPCLLELPLDYTATYEVRVESPTGSVLQSIDRTLDVGTPVSTDPIPMELPLRSIVRGRVTLAPELCDPAEEVDADCGSEGAQVLAERLRVGKESTANTPGPYFHQVETFRDPDTGDGAYVLPLDPGVWIMTALPDPGTAGGPAKYVLVDTSGVPEFDQPFVLEPGILVTLDLATFDRSSLVLPLDIGSWRFQPELLTPDEDDGPALIDLMQPGACLGDPNRGCSIRRLVTSTGLSLTQVGQVRFTARSRGGDAARSCITL
jgi:hypothetical protein